MVNLKNIGQPKKQWSTHQATKPCVGEGEEVVTSLDVKLVVNI